MFSLKKGILSKQDCRFLWKRCPNSYTSENMIIKHKDQCIQKRTTSFKTLFDSHLHWKNHFDKNCFYFRVNANFEADNEIDNSSIGNKTNNTYKQNPVCNGYEIISELEDVLKNC